MSSFFKDASREQLQEIYLLVPHLNMLIVNDMLDYWVTGQFEYNEALDDVIRKLKI